MFTGLIEDVGRISAVEATSGGVAGARRLTIESRLCEEELPLGASLAVDGTCLTVTAWQPGRVQALAGPETLDRTTLGRLVVGSRVNLERSLRVGDRLGGHLVSGHVDAVGQVDSRQARGEALDVGIAPPLALLRYVVEKGSIAIDGISLTVNRVDGRAFYVSLIPHTQGATSLSEKGVGAEVNLEADVIAKYVEKLLAGHTGEGPRGGVTLDQLKENGFA